MLPRIVAPFALAALVSLSFSAEAGTIDEFTDDQFVLIPIGPPTPQSANDTTPLGGFLVANRTIVLDRTVGFGIASVDSNLTQASQLSFNTGAGVVATATVVYTDFVGGALDVTDAGESEFVEIFARSDLDATIRVSFQSGGSLSSFDFALNGTGTGLGDPFQFLNVNFAGLMGDADLTAVDTIFLDIFGPPSLDLQIDLLRTVKTPIPEPGTLALLGLGVAALATRRSTR